MRISPSIVVLVGALAVSACGAKNLRVLESGSTGPDEFLILPSKPLTPPTDYAALPTPTPGGANLTDATPQQDLVASLGGRPSALTPGAGVPAGDSALVAAASRHGVEPGVRETLTAQHEKALKKARRSGRLKIVPVDRYKQAFEKEALDPYLVTERFRRSGFGTPSSPPDN